MQKRIFQQEHCRRAFSNKALQKSIFQQGIAEEDLMIWGQDFSSLEKLKLQFISGRQKVAGSVKMLNDLSLAK